MATRPRKVPGVYAFHRTPEYKRWMEKLADHCRLKVPDTVDRALVELARLSGFDEPAPIRSPRDLPTPSAGPNP